MELVSALDALAPLDGLPTGSGIDAKKVRDIVNDCAIDRIVEPADRTLEGLRARISSVSAAHQQGADFERRLRQSARGVVGAILDLSPAGTDLPGAVDALRQEQLRLVEAGPDTAEGLRAMRAVLPDLLARAIGALAAARSVSPGEIDGAVKSGQYWKAIDALRGSPAPSLPATSAGAEAEPDGVLSFSASPRTRNKGRAEVAAAPAGQKRTSDVDPVVPPPGAAGGRPFYESRTFFNAIRILNSALIGLLVACTAVSVHARSFVGTPADLLAVFVWTAGVNTVTADLLGTLASKLAPYKAA